MIRLLITGTGTGVGKTQVTAAIATRLRREGRRVAAVKPLITGCDGDGDPAGGEAADDVLLALATGFAGDPATLCAYRFRAPLSPLAAARREAATVEIGPIRALLERHDADTDVLLVEGVGGALVPLAPGFTVADMAVRLGLAALVVCRPGLGTVNHTLLTVEALRSRGVALTGFVVSMRPGVSADTAAENADIVSAETGLACAGRLEVVGDMTPAGWFTAAGGIDLDVALGRQRDTPPPDDAPERAAGITTIDRAHLWHPFTQTAEWLAEDPPVIAAGDGCWLQDVDGRRYLDGTSSLWCNVHGHRHPRITAAVHRQLDRVAHTTLLGLTHEPAARLAAELARRTPSGLTRVFFSDAGATAVEVALRLAVEQWERRGQPQRSEFISLRSAYHGDTIGSVSVGHSDVFHRALETMIFPVHKIDPPHALRVRDGMSEGESCRAGLLQLDRLLERRGHHIAGCIVEPRVQGAAGLWLQPPGYLAGVQDACRRHGVLFICDEVATGFGRTGDMFASLGEGVTPDLMTLGKGLSGGYLPLAATLATESIFEAFTGPYEEFQTFFHGHTFTGNPLGCAAALAGLEAFDQEDTLARGRRAGDLLGQRLDPLIGLPHVKEVRRCGLMVGIELQEPEHGGPLPVGLRAGRRVTLAARDRGVLIRPLGDVVIVMPPLVITDEEVDLLAGAVRESVEEVCATLVTA